MTEVFIDIDGRGGVTIDSIPFLEKSRTDQECFTKAHHELVNRGSPSVVLDLNFAHESMHFQEYLHSKGYKGSITVQKPKMASSYALK